MDYVIKWKLYYNLLSLKIELKIFENLDFEVCQRFLMFYVTFLLALFKYQPFKHLQKNSQ